MSRSRFGIAAGIWLAAAIAAAVSRAIDTYDHGIWLVAYLLLVGAVAQALLGRGQAALLGEPPPGRGGAQVALWNAGVVLVPLGVLTDLRICVAIGSVLLLFALGSFARAVGSGGRGADGGRPQERRAARIRSAGADRRTTALYSALLIFMLISVCIGYLLSGDIPWFG